MREEATSFLHFNFKRIGLGLREKLARKICYNSGHFFCYAFLSVKAQFILATIPLKLIRYRVSHN